MKMKDEKDKFNGVNKKASERTKRRGFYAALYSCVGVMLVIAIAVSYTNFSDRNQNPAVDPGGSYAMDDGYSSDAGAEVGLNEAQSYLDRINARESYDDFAFFGNRATATPEAAAATAAPTTQPISGTNAATPAPPEQAESERVDPSATASADGTNMDSTAEGLNSAGAEQTPSPAQSPEQAENTGEQTFGSYSGSDRMVWPLMGEIVMDFSVDRLIFDATLEQYRTNDSISIAAYHGDEVIASGDGVVKDIYTSREYGRTVLIDHGNGWSTRYSQLDDIVRVNVGEIVRAGSPIGNIGNPSIFSVALGSHLQFEVRRDNNPIDPKEILIQF